MPIGRSWHSCIGFSSFKDLSGDVIICPTCLLQLWQQCRILSVYRQIVHDWQSDTHGAFQNRVCNQEHFQVSFNFCMLPCYNPLKYYIQDIQCLSLIIKTLPSWHLDTVLLHWIQQTLYLFNFVWKSSIFDMLVKSLGVHYRTWDLRLDLGLYSLLQVFGSWQTKAVRIVTA